MPLKARHQGALRSITRLSVRVGGVLRPLKTLKVMDNGTLRTIGNWTSPLSASAVPAVASGSVSSPGPETVVSNSVTCSPVGGAAPFTYSWALLSGAVTIDNPSGATTTFSVTTYNQQRTGFARCTVTDSFGTTATADVQFSLIHAASGGGFES